MTEPYQDMVPVPIQSGGTGWMAGEPGSSRFTPA